MKSKRQSKMGEKLDKEFEEKCLSKRTVTQEPGGRNIYKLWKLFIPCGNNSFQY